MSVLFARTPTPVRGVAKPASKSVPEKLLRFFVAFKLNPTASFGSRATPPIPYGTLDADPFAAGPADSYYAPYEAFSDIRTPLSKTTSPPQLYQVTPAMQALPSKATPGLQYPTGGDLQIQLEDRSCHVVVKIQEDDVTVQIAPPKSYGQSKTTGPRSRSMSNREILQDFTKRTLREAVMSKWFSKKAIPKKSRAITSEDGKRSILPKLERFSTTKGLHGASRLGNEIQKNGLSCGKCRRVRDLVKSISSIFKDRKGSTIPTTSHPPNLPNTQFPAAPRRKPSSSPTSPSIRPMTPLPSHTPQCVVRNGREDWAKIVVVTNQRPNKYHEYFCDSQGRPIRSLNWI